MNNMPLVLNKQYTFASRKTRSLKSSGNKAFTLVELLVVVSLIIGLASIVVGIQRGVHKKQAVSKAKGEMQAIALALEEFKGAYGDYPWIAYSSTETGERDNSQMLFKALTGQAYLRSTKVGDSAQIEMITLTSGEIRKSFIDPSKMSLNSDNDEFLDPWGGRYYYAYRAPRLVSSNEPKFSEDTWRSPQFILFTKGLDGEADTGDIDLVNGTMPRSAKEYYEHSSGLNHDNLVYNLDY